MPDQNDECDNCGADRHPEDHSCWRCGRTYIADPAGAPEPGGDVRQASRRHWSVTGVVDNLRAAELRPISAWPAAAAAAALAGAAVAGLLHSPPDISVGNLVASLIAAALGGLLSGVLPTLGVAGVMVLGFLMIGRAFPAGKTRRYWPDGIFWRAAEGVGRLLLFAGRCAGKALRTGWALTGKKQPGQVFDLIDDEGQRWRVRVVAPDRGVFPGDRVTATGIPLPRSLLYASTLRSVDNRFIVRTRLPVAAAVTALLVVAAATVLLTS